MKTLSLEEALVEIRKGKRVFHGSTGYEGTEDELLVSYGVRVPDKLYVGFRNSATKPWLDGYYIQSDPVEEAVKRLLNSTTRTSGEIYSCVEAIRTAYLAEKQKWEAK